MFLKRKPRFGQPQYRPLLHCVKQMIHNQLAIAVICNLFLPLSMKTDHQLHTQLRPGILLHLSGYFR